MNALYFLDEDKLNEIDYFKDIDYYEYIDENNYLEVIKSIKDSRLEYISHIYDNIDEMIKYFINRKNRSRKELKKINKIKKIKNKDIKKLELYIFYYEDEINEIYYMINSEGICSTEIFMAEDSIEFFIKNKKILIKKVKKLKKINK